MSLEQGPQEITTNKATKGAEHVYDQSQPPRKWTEDEDEIIVRLQADIGNRWSEIAKLLSGRSGSCVKSRWHSTLHRRRTQYCMRSNAETLVQSKKRPCPGSEPSSDSSDKQYFDREGFTSKAPTTPWSKDEDDMLYKTVSSLLSETRKSWPLIAAQLPGRTGKQCWQRYHYHLKTQYKSGEWMPEEDQIILSERARVGNCWSLIATLLPGRSHNSIKNRWHSSLRQRGVLTPAERSTGVSSSPPPERAVPTVVTTSGRTGGGGNDCPAWLEGCESSISNVPDLRKSTHAPTVTANLPPSSPDHAPDISGAGDGASRLSFHCSKKFHNGHRMDTPASPGRHTRHWWTLGAMLAPAFIAIRDRGGGKGLDDEGSDGAGAARDGDGGGGAARPGPWQCSQVGLLAQDPHRRRPAPPAQLLRHACVDGTVAVAQYLRLPGAVVRSADLDNSDCGDEAHLAAASEGGGGACHVEPAAAAAVDGANITVEPEVVVTVGDEWLELLRLSPLAWKEGLHSLSDD
jgi:hypothetical protein